MTPTLRDYDAERFGPFLGVSDEGSAAEAIRDAAFESPKGRALGGARDPLALGVAHDAERLGSIGEVPVGPDQYARIREVAAGELLITTNVGSHVNIWHYQQPPGFDVAADTTRSDLAEWARNQAEGRPDRNPQPWLRLRFADDATREVREDALRAVAAEAPVSLCVKAERGAGAMEEAIAIAAASGAAAVVVDGVALAPTEGRPALPGLLNYFAPKEARQLLRAARDHRIEIEPALKVDTHSVANQIWTGLFAAREMGLHLGKYGLFPLTFREIREVVTRVQHWMKRWSAAPAFYVDVPWVDGGRVYEISEALEATRRWIELVAGCGAQVVLIDTVDKAQGRRLVKSGADDDPGIFTWDDLDALEAVADSHGVRVLWAGGIPVSQVRQFGRRRSFGIYVTSAASELRPLGAGEADDIGLAEAKEPKREMIALVKLLLEAGFIADDALEADALAAEQDDCGAVERLSEALSSRWGERLTA